MKLEGTFVVRAAREVVWDQIRNPGIMGECIPGCEAVEQLDATSYRAIVGIKVGPIKARFNLVVEVTQEEPPSVVHSRTRGEEGTRASIVTSENILVLTEVGPSETRVDYSAEVGMTGRLGKYGLGIMQKRAEGLSLVFVENFRRKVEPATVVSI
jgi:carbon monoxide dehydrogenase subunit G